jgi:hypothetical protein
MDYVVEVKSQGTEKKDATKISRALERWESGRVGEI